MRPADYRVYILAGTREQCPALGVDGLGLLWRCDFRCLGNLGLTMYWMWVQV